MYFQSNIKLLRKRRGKTQNDLADLLDMRRPTLSGYENGVGTPNLAGLVSFSDYFGISIDTLIREDLSKLGEMQLSELERGNDVYVKGAKTRILVSTVDSQDNENIELVNQRAKAGYTRGFADPNFIRELPRFQLPFLSRQRKYRTFQIEGDSMLPIPDGAWVTGEFVLDWNDLSPRQACIVVTLEEGLVFKVLEKDFEHGCFHFHSLNPAYPPYTMKTNEIKEVWKFVHYISSEFPYEGMTNTDVVKLLAQLNLEVGQIRSRLNL